MPARPSQWEQIFRNAGHILPEPAETVIQFAERLKELGITSILDRGCGSGRQVIHHAMLETVIATVQEIQRVVCKGGMVLISVPARREIAMDGEASIEIEPDTFVPTSGSEKCLPHHLFTADKFRKIFPKFQILDLQVIDGRIIALTASKI